jgi:hypothetical protein
MEKSEFKYKVKMSKQVKNAPPNVATITSTEEWDILVEESKQHKFLMEPITHTLTKQELIDLIIYVKVYGSYSTPDKVLEVYLETRTKEKTNSIPWALSVLGIQSSLPIIW